MPRTPLPRPKRIPRTGSVAVSPYVLSFQSQRFYRGWRYHWMICTARNPDKLVSWGYAPTRELAETVAGNEVENLVARLTKGGRVTSAAQVIRADRQGRAPARRPE